MLNGAKLRKGRLWYFVDSMAASCRRTCQRWMMRLRKDVSMPSLAACPMILQHSANADCSFSTHGNTDTSNSGGVSVIETNISIYCIYQYHHERDLGTKYVMCDKKRFWFPHIERCSCKHTFNRQPTIVTLLHCVL